MDVALRAQSNASPVLMTHSLGSGTSDRRNGTVQSDRDFTEPPHNHQAEEAVLGSVLKNPAAIVEIGWLPADAFHHVPHRHIYRAMVALAADGLPPDHHLVADRLQQQGTYDDVGGLLTLSQIDLATPSAAHIEFYARVIHRTATMRALIAKAQLIAEMAYRDNLDADAALEKAEQALSELRRYRFEAEDSWLPVETAADLMAGTTELPAVVAGMAVIGGTTELVAKIKLGKTTLVMEAIKAELRGLPFLGFPARPPRPVVLLSEQNSASLAASLRRSGLQECRDLHVVRWAAVHDREWRDVASAAAQLAQRVGAELFVVDTLFAFAGITSEGGENDSALAQKALAPVQVAVDAQSLAALVVRHEGKARGVDISDAGRGSSAFGGGVDILLRLRRPDGNTPPNQRLLEYVGRFDGFPERRLLEWHRVDGYLDLGDPEQAGKRRTAAVVFAALPPDEADALTVEQISQQCPNTRRTYVYEALGGMVTVGDIQARGTGRKGDPTRYWRRDRKNSSETPRGSGRMNYPDSSETVALNSSDESIEGRTVQTGSDESATAVSAV